MNSQSCTPTNAEDSGNTSNSRGSSDKRARIWRTSPQRAKPSSNNARQGAVSRMRQP